MFKYDFGELGVRPMRVNHKLSPSQGWDGEPCLTVTVTIITSFIHSTCLVIKDSLRSNVFGFRNRRQRNVRYLIHPTVCCAYTS